MTTEQILAEDRLALKQVENAIIMLSADKRTKAQNLINKFQKLRENLIISIESNEQALVLEQRCKQESLLSGKIVFVI